MRILFTGGGTGGHVYPIIAVAEQLKKIDNQVELYFLGAEGFSQALEDKGIKAKTILAAKLRRYFSLLTLVDMIKLPIGLIQSLWYLYILMPDVIFSKGGFGSVPVVLAGWLYRIPILTHESDTIPGLANRINAKFSKRIALSFDRARDYFPQQKTALTGNPIRSNITQICLSNDPVIKQKAREILKLTSPKPVIFIMGGSQGALKISQVVLTVLPQLLEKYEIIHQVGDKNIELIKSNLDQNHVDYHLFPFLNEQEYAFALLSADLIISRSGSNIFEIAACGKPSILIPLPNSANDHQKENAFVYAQAGATVVIDQVNLTPNLFLNEIDKVLTNSELKQKMTANARNFSKTEAAEKIVQGLIELGS